MAQVGKPSLIGGIKSLIGGMIGPPAGSVLSSVYRVELASGVGFYKIELASGTSTYKIDLG